jgi:hypothetical protein
MPGAWNAGRGRELQPISLIRWSTTWIRAAPTGFMLAATYTQGCFEEFADYVVPELQRLAGSAQIYGHKPGKFARETCGILKIS